MPSRPCLTCGALSSGSYCPSHEPERPSRQTPGRGGGGAAARFRHAVLARAGHRCEVAISGVRCTATIGLETHHVVALVDGGGNDPDNGRAVCRRHHRMLEKRGS